MHYNNGDVYEGNWVVDKKKERVFIIIRMVGDMKVTSKMIRRMVKE